MVGMDFMLVIARANLLYLTVFFRSMTFASKSFGGRGAESSEIVMRNL